MSRPANAAGGPAGPRGCTSGRAGGRPLVHPSTRFSELRAVRRALWGLCPDSRKVLSEFRSEPRIRSGRRAQSAWINSASCVRNAGTGDERECGASRWPVGEADGTGRQRRSAGSAGSAGQRQRRVSASGGSAASAVGGLRRVSGSAGSAGCGGVSGGGGSAPSAGQRQRRVSGAAGSAGAAEREQAGVPAVADVRERVAGGPGGRVLGAEHALAPGQGALVVADRLAQPPGSRVGAGQVAA